MRLDEADIAGIQKNIAYGEARAIEDLPNIVEDLSNIPAGVAQNAAEGADIPDNLTAHPPKPRDGRANAMAFPASVHGLFDRRSSPSCRMVKRDGGNVTELSFDFDTPFSEIPRASMKLLSALTLFSTIVLATPDTKKPAVGEESVAPTAFEGRGKPRPQLISSDLNGRDLQFITSTVDLRDTLVFLAGKTGESENSNLQTMGKELQKNLPSQTAVLSTLA